jgi:hypothetical protein
MVRRIVSLIVLGVALLLAGPAKADSRAAETTSPDEGEPAFVRVVDTSAETNRQREKRRKAKAKKKNHPSKALTDLRQCRSTHLITLPICCNSRDGQNCGKYKHGECINTECVIHEQGHVPGMPRCKLEAWCPGLRDESGCFVKDTLIRLADGSQKEIRFVTEGELIRNPVSGEAVRVKRVIAGPEPVPVVEISVSDTVLRVTEEHPLAVRRDILGVMMRNAGYSNERRPNREAELHQAELRTAREVKPGDALLLPDGSFAAVIEVRRRLLPAGENVYNIELDAPPDSAGSHLLEANGVVAGDLFLQQRGKTAVSVEGALPSVPRGS